MDGKDTSTFSSSSVQSELEEDMMMELRRGPWTIEEDFALIYYIAIHGEGRWNSLPRCAGLNRTGKSCRLRWLNHLRPDVRRGNITLEEQLLILELHSRWGNRWSKIAQHLPGRTDNEIKNYWRTRVQKHAKQLKCDVNSKQFKDTMRYLWMPRLVERIQAASAAGAGTSGSSASTSTTNNNNINSFSSSQVGLPPASHVGTNFGGMQAILMQSGHDGEGPQGLFTLKTASETQDKGDSSHTIAYEDRGDVTNFCYLLHSFFEDLEDFSAEILPFPTKFVGLKLSDNICLNPEVASSDQESIEELYAEVINSSTEKNFDNYQIDLATESPPRTHDLLNGGALQLAVEDDTINNGNDVISAGKSYITATDLVKEGKIKPTTREHRKNETSISYEVVKGHFGMKLEDAAEKLDVSRSTLKRLCRQNGVPRWPSHKRKKVNHPLSNQDPSSSNPPTDQAIQDGRIATIKAEYGDDIIKFKLSFSSRMRDLEEEVGKRLKLENGTFKIKYVDGDGDRILIACDADLNDCIHFLTSSGITTIKMFVELGALS